MGNERRLRPGEWVEVRSREEVLATLDQKGCLDGLPFMPEMLRYCGQRLRVFKSAYKTCDSMHYGDGRLMREAVFLDDVRCDGSRHAGCQARCLIFFKTAWLRRPGDRPPVTGSAMGVGEEGLERTTQFVDGDGTVTYRCQATQHLAATRPFKWYALGPLLEDLRSGNASVRELVRGVTLQLVWRMRFLGVGWRFAMWLYRWLHEWTYGGPDPHVSGRIPTGSPTPAVALDVKPGEWVRVKSLEEITATLNVNNRNRGLSFNPEMAPYCNGTYMVEQRVTRIIDEKTGKLLEMKGPCIMLKGVYCQARYHPEALLCQRRIPQYFREAWLTRTERHDLPSSAMN